MFFARVVVCALCACASLTAFSAAADIIITEDTTLGPGAAMAKYVVQSGTLTVEDGADIYAIGVAAAGRLVFNGGRVRDEVHPGYNAVFNGGHIQRAFLGGASTINGGYIRSVTAYGEFTMNGGQIGGEPGRAGDGGGGAEIYSGFTFNGGVIRSLIPVGGPIEMNGGELIYGAYITDHDIQTMTIRGGSPGKVHLGDSDITTIFPYTIHVYGGQFRGDAMIETAGTASVANIYGSELRRLPGTVINRQGLPIPATAVTGILEDGTWFRAASPNDWFVLHNSSPPTEYLPGDANYDGTVDIADLNLVRNNFGSYAQGDMDGDGVVGIEDLNSVRNNFGAALPQAVPEPSSLALMALALISLAKIPSRRRRRCPPLRFP